MSTCKCGRIEIPLGLTTFDIDDVVHGVTECSVTPSLFGELVETRNALHTAFAIIANAQNCLGNGDRDVNLAAEWYEAAQRFMDDYNANLDVYTGYQVRGGTE